MKRRISCAHQETDPDRVTRPVGVFVCPRPRAAQGRLAGMLEQCRCSDPLAAILDPSEEPGVTYILPVWFIGVRVSHGRGIPSLRYRL